MRQNFKKIFAFALASAAIICSCGFKPQKYSLSHLYPSIGVVTDYNPTNGRACLITDIGINADYYPEKYADVGDVVCVIMHNNNTEDFTGDDYAVKVVPSCDWERLLTVLRDWYIDMPRRQNCG